MRILQINKLYYPVVGGIETVVQQVAEGINKTDDFIVDVLACNSEFKTVREQINGVMVTRASSFGIFFSMPVSISFFLLLNKLWKSYDLLHLHLPFPLGELALWLIRPKCRLIITYHSDIIRQRFISSALNWLHTWVLGHAEKIAVSNPNIIETSPLLKRFKAKCTVIPFGVDMKRFSPDNSSKQSIEQIRQRYGKRIVLFVGRLVYYKGTEYLIRAMKDIDARLVIIGEGPMKRSLINEVNTQGLENKVTFLPCRTQDELVNFYRASSVFVLPSLYRSEAFGITIIEAMACGLPVISTELGTGTSYANMDGVTGFVVSPGNSDDLSTPLKKLLSDPVMASNMGRAGYQRIKTAFTIDTMLNKYKNLYRISPL